MPLLEHIFRRFKSRTRPEMALGSVAQSFDSFGLPAHIRESKYLQVYFTNGPQDHSTYQHDYLSRCYRL
jgi:hypothetical protein